MPTIFSREFRDSDDINIKMKKIIKKCKKLNILYNLNTRKYGIIKYSIGYKHDEYNKIEILNIVKNFNVKLQIDEFACYTVTKYEHLDVLEWLKQNYGLNLNNVYLNTTNAYILNFWLKNYNIKKVIKKCEMPKKYVGKYVNKEKNNPWKILKSVVFKTKNNYLKGYNKN